MFSLKTPLSPKLQRIAKSVPTKGRTPSPIFFLFQFLFFKIPVFAPIRIARHSGFTYELVVDPVFFNVVAGSTTLGFPEISPLVIGPHLGNMGSGIEILVDMAALTIFVDDPVAFGGGILTLKGIFNVYIRTPPTHWNQTKNQIHPPALDPFND